MDGSEADPEPAISQSEAPFTGGIAWRFMVLINTIGFRV